MSTHTERVETDRDRDRCTERDLLMPSRNKICGIYLEGESVVCYCCNYAYIYLSNFKNFKQNQLLE